jgi:hypothetical protein
MRLAGGEQAQIATDCALRPATIILLRQLLVTMMGCVAFNRSAFRTAGMKHAPAGDRAPETCPTGPAMTSVTRRAHRALTESRLATRDAGDPSPRGGEGAWNLPSGLRPARRLSGDGRCLAHPGAVFWPTGPNRPSPRGCGRPSHHLLPLGRRRSPTWPA